MLELLNEPTLPLSRLGEVPWASLHHAYGSAADVPGLLRALASADTTQRSTAMGRLWGNVYHQETRWEVSQYCIPFLVGLLLDDATPDKAWIAGYLRALAMGIEAGDVEALPFDAAEQRRAAEPAESMSEAERAHITAALYDDDEDWHEQGDAVHAWHEFRCFQQTAQRADLLAGLLPSAEDQLCVELAALLPWLRPEKHGWDDRSTRALQAERAEVAAVSLAIMLGLFGGSELDEPTRAALQTRMHESKSEALRVASAVALLNRLGDKAPEAVLDVLIGAADSVRGWETRIGASLSFVQPLSGLVVVATIRAGLR